MKNCPACKEFILILNRKDPSLSNTLLDIDKTNSLSKPSKNKRKIDKIIPKAIEFKLRHCGRGIKEIGSFYVFWHGSLIVHTMYIDEASVINSLHAR